MLIVVKKKKSADFTCHAHLSYAQHFAGYRFDPAAARLDRLCDSLGNFEQALVVERGHDEGQKQYGQLRISSVIANTFPFFCAQ